MTGKPKIAIIGAGIAGMRLARLLQPVGEVEVFEKSRGLGGRMSTRRTPDYQFDHGAQYFTARGADFQAFLKPFIENGTVAEWRSQSVVLNCKSNDVTGHSHIRYVAVPGMTALCKAMAEGIDVQRECRVANAERNAGFWTLTLEDGNVKGGYDWIFSTAPAEQSALLLPELTDWTQVKMQGCYSLMLGFDSVVELPFEAAVVKNNPIAWIANNSSKPGRSGKPAVLCQSDSSWAEEWLEADAHEVEQLLSAAFLDLTGIDPNTAKYSSLHKWRFAKVLRALPQPFLFDVATQCGTAGDWCGRGRVESAFESAEKLADIILRSLKKVAP